MEKIKNCPMCHRHPQIHSLGFCSPECRFEWEEYDRYMDLKAPTQEERIIFPPDDR